MCVLAKGSLRLFVAFAKCKCILNTLGSTAASYKNSFAAAYFLILMISSISGQLSAPQTTTGLD